MGGGGGGWYTTVRVMFMTLPFLKGTKNSFVVIELYIARSNCN